MSRYLDQQLEVHPTLGPHDRNHNLRQSNLPGTNISVSEALRLACILLIPPYLLAGLLFILGLVSKPDNLLGWIVVLLAGPAAWGAFLSAVSDSRTLLGRPAINTNAITDVEVANDAYMSGLGSETEHANPIQLLVANLKSDAVKSGNTTVSIELVSAKDYLDSVNYAGSNPNDFLHHLPTRSVIFEGRQLEIQEILTYLLHRETSIAKVVAIRGMVGTGKTEISLQASSKLLESYPDIQLFLDCSPDDKPLTAHDLMAVVVQKISPNLDLPNTADQRTNLLYSVTHGKRGLIIFDNVQTADQLEPLLPILKGWSIIVTTRRRFSLPNAKLLDINELDPSESKVLLKKLLSQGGRIDILDTAGKNLEALGKLADYCGNLPLALRIAASYLCNIVDCAIDEYLEGLKSDPLEYLSIEGERALVPVLATSIVTLNNSDPQLAHAWKTLALISGPFDLSDARGVLGILGAQLEQIRSDPPGYKGELKVIPRDEASTRKVLSSLVQHNLLTFDRGAHTYSQHSLLREFAFESSKFIDWNDDQVSEYTLYSFHYLTKGAELSKMLGSSQEETEWVLRQFDMIWPQLKSIWENRNWQNENGLAQIWLANFSSQLSKILELRLEASERVKYYQTSVRSAQALGITGLEAQGLGNLGNAYYLMNKPQESLDFHKRALAINQRIGNMHDQALDLGNIGGVYLRLEDTEQAKKYTSEALEVSRSTNDVEIECMWLGNLSIIYSKTGQAHLARKYALEAVEIAHRIGKAKLEAGSLIQMAQLLEKDEEFDEALIHLNRGLSLGRDCEDKWLQALALSKIGEIEIKNEMLDQAEQDLAQAMDLAQQVGDRSLMMHLIEKLAGVSLLLDKDYDAQDLYTKLFEMKKAFLDCIDLVETWQFLDFSYRNVGDVESGKEKFSDILECFGTAIDIARRSNDVLAEAVNLGNLAAAWWIFGDAATAIMRYDDAIDLLTEIDEKEHRAKLLFSLGSIYQRQQQVSDAYRCWVQARSLLEPNDDELFKYLDRLVSELENSGIEA